MCDLRVSVQRNGCSHVPKITFADTLNYNLVLMAKSLEKKCCPKTGAEHSNKNLISEFKIEHRMPVN